MLRWSIGVGLAVLGLLIPASESRAGMLGVAGDFNGFILGNYTESGGDTEGRLAIGGNANLSSYSVASKLDSSYNATNNLVVGGDLNAPGRWQVFRGNAVYGGSLIAAPTTPLGSTFQSTPIDFDAVGAALVANSTYWAGLTPNGTALKQWSTLHITGNDPVLNIINVSSSDWASVSDRQITAPAGSTLLININGKINSASGGLALHGIDPSRVLYNFSQTESIRFENILMLGSVLAPKADATLIGGAINGTGIFKSGAASNGFEFHYPYAFAGNLPLAPPAVPEPSGLVLAGIGIVSMLGLRWRRRLSAGA